MDIQSGEQLNFSLQWEGYSNNSLSHLPSETKESEEIFGVQMDDTQAIIADFEIKYFTPIVGIFGIAGNVINLLVLSRVRYYHKQPANGRQANRGLIALAVSDMLFCVCILPRTFVNPFSNLFHTYSFSLYYQTYSTGLISLFILTSTFITVILSVSRYLTMCQPFRALGVVKTMSSVWSYTIASFLALVLNMPMFFQYQINKMVVENSTDTSTTLIYLDINVALHPFTTQGQVYMWIRFLLGVAAPTLIIIVCNIALIHALRSSARLQRDCHVLTRNVGRQNNISVLFIVIAVLYVVLVLPGELLNFIKDSSKEGIELSLKVRPFTNMLQMLNFACMFVIYCALNVHFRDIVVGYLQCKSRSDLELLGRSQSASFRSTKSSHNTTPV